MHFPQAPPLPHPPTPEPPPPSPPASREQQPEQEGAGGGAAPWGALKHEGGIDRGPDAEGSGGLDHSPLC